MELLRTDVRKQKANIMGQVMQFDADDVAKFWPIYKEYDAELARIGDEKLAMIKKYADNYENMTDAVADQLVRAAIQIDQQRHDLKAKYYGRVKDALGGNARQIDFLSRSGQTLNFPVTSVASVAFSAVPAAAGGEVRARYPPHRQPARQS